MFVLAQRWILPHNASNLNLQRFAAKIVQRMPSVVFCFVFYFFHSLDFFPITEQYFYSSFALSAQNAYRKRAKKARMTRVTPAPWCGHDLTHAQYHPGMYQTNLVPRVFVPLVQRNGKQERVSCFPFRWTKGTKTLGTRLVSDSHGQLFRRY